MFSIPQTVLSELLSYKNTTPERLSDHEMAIALRICHCTLCNTLWIRRLKILPDRCPRCHKRGWDRPLLSALLRAAPPEHTPRLFSSTATQPADSRSLPPAPEKPEDK